MKKDLPHPDRAAYFLDFDGTLIDIAPAPDRVHVPDMLVPALRGLSAKAAGALAIVSGRPLGQIDALLGQAFPAAGQHGAERRFLPGAAPEYPDFASPDAAWVAAAAVLVASHPGSMLEQKRHGFVLHFRAVPEAAEALRGGLQRLVAGHADFEIMPTKAAWELRPKAAHKGAAVQALMRQAPFAGRVPLYVGDDVTDEDGIEAVQRLGGIGLRVDPDFGGPAGVRAWIAELAA